MRDADLRWSEAGKRAENAFNEGDIGRWVSADSQNFAIDNLLGAYFPNERRVVLYRRMIGHAAKVLAVDEDSLTTVVFVHETVHAFSHLGRDLDHTYWRTFAIPLATTIDGTPSRLHETIAQYFTYKLLERLQDELLTKAFLTLENASLEVYRAWREKEYDTLEQMRAFVMRSRNASGS